MSINIKPHPEDPLKTPCVRNCCLNGQDICVGCGRSLAEIRSWTAMTIEQRRLVLIKAEGRLKDQTLRLS